MCELASRIETRSPGSIPWLIRKRASAWARSSSASAVAGILEAVVQGGLLSLEEGLALEYRAMERTAGSKDTLEGVRAFFEKRKPVFKGE